MAPCRGVWRAICGRAVRAIADAEHAAPHECRPPLAGAAGSSAGAICSVQMISQALLPDSARDWAPSPAEWTEMKMTTTLMDSNVRAMSKVRGTSKRFTEIAEAAVQRLSQGSTEAERRRHSKLAGYNLVSVEDHDGDDDDDVEEAVRKPSLLNSRNGSKSSNDDMPAELLQESQDGSRTMRQRGMDLLLDVRFQSFMALLIMGNAIVIGLETDMPHVARWDVIENIFLFVFAAELLTRMYVLSPSKYFSIDNPDVVWNVFDCTIVGMGLADAGVSMVHSSGGGGGFATVFRIVRLLRIIRIFRIVRFLKQLYMLAFGFALAAEAVFWVAILMAFMLYTWSIILVRTVGQLSDDYPNAEFLRHKFGNIIQSMLTLFELISQPNIEPYTPVLKNYLPLTAFLIVFIIFGSFGMIALLTGVISESMFSKNELRQEEARQKREAHRQVLVASCAELFDSFEKDDDGEVEKEEIVGGMQQIKDLFDQFDIDLGKTDLEDMLQCIDADGSGGISRHEFLRGILQLVEGVRPMLILQVYYGVEHLKELAEQHQRDMKTVLTYLHGLNLAIVGVQDRLRKEGFDEQPDPFARSNRTTPWEEPGPGDNEPRPSAREHAGTPLQAPAPILPIPPPPDASALSADGSLVVPRRPSPVSLVPAEGLTLAAAESRQTFSAAIGGIGGSGRTWTNGSSTGHGLEESTKEVTAAVPTSAPSPPPAAGQQQFDDTARLLAEEASSAVAYSIATPLVSKTRADELSSLAERTLELGATSVGCDQVRESQALIDEIKSTLTELLRPLRGALPSSYGALVGAAAESKLLPLLRTEAAGPGSLSSFGGAGGSLLSREMLLQVQAAGLGSLSSFGGAGGPLLSPEMLLQVQVLEEKVAAAASAAVASQARNLIREMFVSQQPPGVEEQARADQWSFTFAGDFLASAEEAVAVAATASQARGRATIAQGQEKGQRPVARHIRLDPSTCSRWSQA
mmetsp:Transcript_5421/g.20523  ORF Transcript_5421/g.20523 Transcript_5421/m.20523 type:complete len:973 (+) Transcript_5421:141-3059(+)